MERPLRGRLEFSNPLSQAKEEVPFFYWQDLPKTPSSFCNPSLIGITPGSSIGGKLVIPTLMPNEIVKEVQATKQKSKQTKPSKKTARKKAKSPAKKTPLKRSKAPTS